MGKVLKIAVSTIVMTWLFFLSQYHTTQSAFRLHTRRTASRFSRNLSSSNTAQVNNNMDNTNSDPLLSPYLKPPSQEWILSQFGKSMSLLKWKYMPPDRWEKCSGRTYYFPTINAIFTGIPTTGSSNWLLALIQAESELTREIHLEKMVPIHGRKTRSHRILDMVNRYSGSDFREALSFAVIRNPWTRMVSGFRDKLSGERESSPYYRSIGREIVRKIRGIENPKLLQELFPTFPEYAEWLVREGHYRDVHFTPQINNLCIPHAIYDYIVPLEYSEILGQEIWTKLGVQETNLMGSDDQSPDPRYQKSTLYAKEWLSELNTDLRDRLYSTFRTDFTLVNYSNFTHPDFPLALHESNRSTEFL